MNKLLSVDKPVARQAAGPQSGSIQPRVATSSAACHSKKFENRGISSSVSTSFSKTCRGSTSKLFNSPRTTRISRGPSPVAAVATDDAEATSLEDVDIDDNRRLSFPFVRIVGQDEAKLALKLNVICPDIGGVLIIGDRGTAKSTLVRAFADILPDIDVVPNDPYNSHPSIVTKMGPEVKQRFKSGETLPVETRKPTLVSLPLGATEDRVCGTIDIEEALKTGTKAFLPGLLAAANRGVFYVDEVNLLDDGLVDLVLDSAAGGWNTVEREGMSITHPADYIMIGTGAPDQGELRPQLLDRFGCLCNVYTIFDVEQRMKIIEETIAFESNPKAYINACQEETDALTKQLKEAQELYQNVTSDKDLRVKVSAVCGKLRMDGLRGDIVVVRAAGAHAALNGRSKITIEDVVAVFPMCVNHRLKKGPMDPIGGEGATLRVLMTIAKVFGLSRAEVGLPDRPKPEAVKEEPKAEEKEEEKPAKKAGAWDPSKMLGRR